MIRGRINDNWNKVNTKEELIGLLKNYEGILSTPIIDYLNSLIELEFSVVREYIGEKERASLAELEIYKRIAIYNIYNKALNLFIKNKLQVSENNEGLESLTASISLNDTDHLIVFNFDYSEHCNRSKIPNGYKSMRIGSISLYRTLENKELREAELQRVMNKLEKLWDACNPYPMQPGVIGGPSVQWAYEHAQEVEEYEKRFAELDSKKELSDMEKREIELTNQVRSLLLEDFGLTNKNFEEEIKPRLYFGPQTTKLERKLVKRMPNLTINDNIKYL